MLSRNNLDAYNADVRGFILRAAADGSDLALLHLKTYTQINMRALSPQCRKIIDALHCIDTLHRGERISVKEISVKEISVKEISRHCRIPAKTVSAQLSRLRALGFVTCEPDQSDKRIAHNKTFYRIADPFLVFGLDLNSAKPHGGFDFERFRQEVGRQEVGRNALHSPR